MPDSAELGYIVYYAGEIAGLLAWKAAQRPREITDLDRNTALWAVTVLFNDDERALAGLPMALDRAQETVANAERDAPPPCQRQPRKGGGGKSAGPQAKGF
jgi:hypothetical protein